MRCPSCRSCRPQRVLDTESLDESTVRLRVCMECGTSYRTREAVETVERPRKIPPDAGKGKA